MHACYTQFFYFSFMKQEKCGTSIEGSVVDRFYEQGAGYKYLTPRNKNGAGSLYSPIVFNYAILVYSGSIINLIWINL